MVIKKEELDYIQHIIAQSFTAVAERGKETDELKDVTGAYVPLKDKVEALFWDTIEINGDLEPAKWVAYKILFEKYYREMFE